MTTLRFVPASASPVLEGAAAGATAHFENVKLTRASAQGFRASLLEAGMLVRKTSTPGLLVVAFTGKVS